MRVIDLANGEWAAAALSAETAQACELGIFGSRTFVVVRSCSGVMIASKTRSAGSRMVTCAHCGPDF